MSDMYPCKCGRYGYCPHSPEHKALCFYPECKCGNYQLDKKRRFAKEINSNSQRGEKK